MMETFEGFKLSLLDYLHVEQKMCKRDILEINEMQREDKIEAGLMISNLVVLKSKDNVFVFKAIDNYSKLRSGDSVVLSKGGDSKKEKGVIIDTDIDTITVRVDNEIDSQSVYDMEIESPNLLGSLVSCLEGIVPATPGAAFLRILSGEEQVKAESFLALNPHEINGFSELYAQLSQEQQDAVESMLSFYPIHVLQGPPGTGKTLVLAATSIAASLKNREVVIIANTHQAVNNALMKIRQLSKDIPLFKIGEQLKADGLDKSINIFGKFSEFNEYSKNHRRKKKYGYVIGMTIWGAITNLGLRTHTHFRPYMALVDEASLMPLTYASVLGKCSPIICLFGDSRQMQPIFRPELENNTLSVSILDYCANKVEGVPVSVLPETHRMNKEITKLVSRSFYEPYGITLRSAENIANNCFLSSYMDKNGYVGSVFFANPNISAPCCQEENEGEADAVVDMVKSLFEEGKKGGDIAVVTPFRKQVRLIRSKAKCFLDSNFLTHIDTVERLQGQDVECIILSFAASDESFVKDRKDFIFNFNRLNVMLSRAKTKIIIFACSEIQKELKSLLKFNE